MSRTCIARELVALALSALTASCSSQYRPYAGPRVSVVLEGGAPAYVRDGKTYPHGFAGSGLVEAVEDDPEAREAAETYQSRMTSGFILYLTGTVCLATSLVVALPTAGDDERDTGKDTLIGGTMLCALAGLIAGGAVLASAQPYQYDAINLYNDNVERKRIWSPVPAPYGPLSPTMAPPGTPPLAPPPAGVAPGQPTGAPPLPSSLPPLGPGPSSDAPAPSATPGGPPGSSLPAQPPAPPRQ